MQLSIFDLDTNVFHVSEGVKLQKLSRKKITTLKKNRVYDLRKVEDMLLKNIGCLHLQKLKLSKAYDDKGKFCYYNYLIKKVYEQLFKEKMINLNNENYVEVFRELSEMLSDDVFQVTLEKVENSVHMFFKDFHFYVIVKHIKSDETVKFLTSNTTTKSKYDLRAYYKSGHSKSSIRCVTVNKVLSRLLLDLEVRNYYLNKIEEHGTKADYDVSVFDSFFKKVTVTEGREDWCGYSRSRIHYELSYKFLDTILPKIETARYHVKSLKKTSGDYAASYQLKKNIPIKTKLAMAESDLLKYFDDVEYDESVDLNTVSMFEKEITNFIELFNIRIPGGASFKVRRLGKHKASGLFYPPVCTLVLDVNSPVTFIHECWHMIDYYMQFNEKEFTGERLSDLDSFSEIRRMYKQIVDVKIAELGNEHPYYKRHYGKTKYNKEYFYDATEIFARCAEMYFSKELGETSSIVDPVDTVYYPKDNEKFNSEVSKYFNMLLKGGKYEVRTA